MKIELVHRMRSTFLAILGLFLFTSCEKHENHQKIDELVVTDQVQWIEINEPLPEHDSLFYLEHPAPLFRKEFNTNKPLKSAKLLITAAGYYKATINGNAVGDNALDPAWTDFSKRIYYSEQDVTDLIEAGENCIGVVLGNGFYNPLPLRKWGRRNMRVDLSVGKPTFIAKLILRYESGETMEIGTNDSWKYTYGPIRKNSVYIGVAYDARKEIPGWNKNEFDDASWNFSKVGKGPGGRLEKAFFPPVQVTEIIEPTRIYASTNGGWVVDMGVNFTGTYRIMLEGDEGDSINFRFGERVYDDGSLNPMTAVIGQIKRPGIGGPGAPDIAWQTDSYVLGKNEMHWFSPDFTYHTFRYMEITGLDKKPNLESIRGLALNSNVATKNSFISSSALVNSIQRATQRTFLSNLVSVQSDCPAREKFGYGGDLNATSESFIYNYDMQSFYRKTVYDWVDAMKDLSFVDTAPFAGIEYCGISWESAFLITQYYLYLYYNDTDIIEELYQLDNQWMDKVAMIHPDGIVNSGLSDHESLEPVPVQLTGTGHYLQCAQIMTEFASIMNDDANQKKYSALAKQLKDKMRERFWNQPVNGEINRQTLFSTLLYHKIIPEDKVAAAQDSLLKAVTNGPSGHFSTGIFGTKYVLETLSEIGKANTVFDIVNSTTYPGWGFMIERGATSIWETWKESDNTFSNNHPMFGTVTEWYYRWLAGIRPDPQYPGFKEFILNPTIPEGLEFVEATYYSPYGAIVSNWKKQEGGYSYTVSVPEGSKARVRLPITNSQSISIVGNRTDKLSGGEFELEEGDYQIIISTQR